MNADDARAEPAMRSAACERRLRLRRQEARIRGRLAADAALLARHHSSAPCGQQLFPVDKQVMAELVALREEVGELRELVKVLLSKGEDVQSVEGVVVARVLGQQQPLGGSGSEEPGFPRRSFEWAFKRPAPQSLLAPAGAGEDDQSLGRLVEEPVQGALQDTVAREHVEAEPARPEACVEELCSDGAKGGELQRRRKSPVRRLGECTSAELEGFDSSIISEVNDSDEETDYARYALLLHSLYELRNPSKLHDLPALMRKHADKPGGLKRLYAKVQRKYGYG